MSQTPLQDNGGPLATDSRVSVVIPLYNHERFIARAIDSVIAQSVKATEIIVIDDGSTDGSAAKMRELCAVHPQILFWSWPNQGAHHALNAAILRATGDFVAILNSDDCFHPDRLAECLAVAQAGADVDLVATGVGFVDDEGNPVRNPWYEDAIGFFRAEGSLSLALVCGNFLVSTSNFFIRRSIFDRVGYFSPLRYAHDLEFVFRLLIGGHRIHFVDAPLLEYRMHGRNTIGEDMSRADSERAAIYAFFLHEQWLRGRLSDADVERHVAELRRQCLDELVAHFLEQLASDESSTAPRLPRRLAHAFLDCQRRLAIDWLDRNTRDPLVQEYAQARKVAIAREAETQTEARSAALRETARGMDWLASQRDAWERVARDNEMLLRSTQTALQEMTQAKDWLAGQRDAWERVARNYESELRSIATTLEKVAEAKDWFVAQRDAWERVARDHALLFKSMEAAMQEMTQAKDWLAGQRDAWAQEARAASARAESAAARVAQLDGLLSKSRTELECLRASLEGLRHHRLFRLLQRAGLLKRSSAPQERL